MSAEETRRKVRDRAAATLRTFELDAIRHWGVGESEMGDAVSELRRIADRIGANDSPPQVSGTEVITWEDTTNVAGWQDAEEIAEFARDGGWRCQNIGWVAYEDDECVVVAARRAFDKQAHRGLAERIPKRAIIQREAL